MFRWLRRKRDSDLTIRILADAQEALDAIAEIRSNIAGLPATTCYIDGQPQKIRYEIKRKDPEAG